MAYVLNPCTYFSTGMVSSRQAPTGQMVPLLSTNVQSPVGTRSSMTSRCPTRLVSTTGYRSLARADPVNPLGTFWYHSHLSTQYCDGLRGPFVVYDPNDPHLSLYDVDDGLYILRFTS